MPALLGLPTLPASAAACRFGAPTTPWPLACFPPYPLPAGTPSLCSGCLNTRRCCPTSCTPPSRSAPAELAGPVMPSCAAHALHWSALSHLPVAEACRACIDPRFTQLLAQTVCVTLCSMAAPAASATGCGRRCCGWTRPNITQASAVHGVGCTAQGCCSTQARSQAAGAGGRAGRQAALRAGSRPAAH